MSIDPMSRNLDHHLHQHGSQFRVRKEIPAALRPLFGGQRYLIHSLGAVSRSQARLLRGQVLTQFDLRLARAKNPADPILQEARRLRDQWEYADERDGQLEATFEETVALADRVAAVRGAAAGDTIFHFATGTHTPLEEYFEEWLAEKRFTGKTILLHRKAIVVLRDWCTKNTVATSVQAITRRVVRDFIQRELRAHLSPKTVNRYLSTYRTYWRWLTKWSRAESNPWLDTSVAESHYVSRLEEDATRKAAFEDEQVAALLAGPAPGCLSDLMRVAALTGARINAICELLVKDCLNGTFTFKRVKKERDNRTIPIHSELREIVLRRTAGKKPDEYLFDELPEATPTRPRSSAASQAFTRYRREVGVGAGVNESSQYDFHSFRRWFITKAEHAGQPPHVIETVVGHRRQGESMGRYSKGPSMEQMRACVESVRPPR